jgi:hypothetical protein
MVLIKRVSAWVSHIQVFTPYIEIYAVTCLIARNMDNFKLHAFL